VIGGACAKWTGSAAAALDFAALVVVLCPLLLWAFNALRRVQTSRTREFA
jgi:hypothetical protein